MIAAGADGAGAGALARWPARAGRASSCGQHILLGDAAAAAGAR